jgi:hypothetical protein
MKVVPANTSRLIFCGIDLCQTDFLPQVHKSGFAKLKAQAGYLDLGFGTDHTFIIEYGN